MYTALQRFFIVVFTGFWLATIACGFFLRFVLCLVQLWLTLYSFPWEILVNQFPSGFPQSGGSSESRPQNSVL